MADWIFTARKRFTPASAERWLEYVEWIGFVHVEEVVTVDCMLCEDLIGDLIEEDWKHNAANDRGENRIDWFRNLRYLRKRVVLLEGRDQLLAGIEEPTVEQQPPPEFVQAGFDIVDADAGVSLLTNCGRFPNIFHPSEVNQWGLLPELDRALSIAQQIRADFPDEPHCKDCRVWQLARNLDVGG